jgi:D,D-heptose 1,7-bisphosphate phosphatase
MKQVVILAGGKGTRLKEVTGNLPKPMVPVLGKPLLQHLVEQCVKWDMSNIKLLVSYKKDIIKNYFGDGSRYGAKIEYIFEDVPRGTAGALIDAMTELDEQFLVIYGDTFFDIDLSSIWRFHQSQSADATIFLHPNDHPYDSDLVEVDSKSMVKKMHLYPHDAEWRQNLVNAAVYIFNKKSIQNINLKTEMPDIAKDLFPIMLKAKKIINGYISTEYIKDIGTPKRLAKVEKDIVSGKVVSLRKKMPKIAIFLDRDGTINKEVGHLSKQEDFELIDRVAEAIYQINSAGFLAVVLTNQPVIARGELKEAELKVIHNKMETLLGRHGAYIDGLYYCPHHTDSGFKDEIKALKFDCDCRKPKTGMFLQAKKDLNIILEESWFIGDSTRDIFAAQNAGVKNILVRTGYAGNDRTYRVNPDFVAEDLYEAVQLILNGLGK